MKLAPLGKRWGALAAEICGSLLVVLVLYWLFMVFLYAIFPDGTPLKEMMESTREATFGRYQVERNPDATLATLFRDVRFRRGNSIAWGGARAGMQLYSQDAVQTFDRSGAKISFDASDQLDVGSNSLIVVTRLKEEDDEEGRKAFRVKVDGEVHGSLSAARKLKMEFEAAGHLARFGPGAARFRVSPNGKNSASLAVFAGEARVVDKGRSVRIPANHGVALKKGVAVGSAVPLPAAPAPGAMDREVFRYRLLPPKLRFTWSGGAGEYHFQLSEVPSFQSCLIDRRVAAAEFVTGILAEGKYYWRVSRYDRGVEGHFSRVGRCELVQVLNSPGLEVRFPAGSDGSAAYVVSGSVDAGSRVYVDGKEVPAGGSGEFRHEVRLKPGVNLIRVEALDDAGNAAYRSRIVYLSPDGSVRVGAAADKETQ